MDQDNGNQQQPHGMLSQYHQSQVYQAGVEALEQRLPENYNAYEMPGEGGEVPESYNWDEANYYEGEIPAQGYPDDQYMEYVMYEDGEMPEYGYEYVEGEGDVYYDDAYYEDDEYDEDYDEYDDEYYSNSDVDSAAESAFISASFYYDKDPEDFIEHSLNENGTVPEGSDSVYKLPLQQRAPTLPPRRTDETIPEDTRVVPRTQEPPPQAKLKPVQQSSAPPPKPDPSARRHGIPSEPLPPPTVRKSRRNPAPSNRKSKLAGYPGGKVAGPIRARVVAGPLTGGGNTVEFVPHGRTSKRASKMYAQAMGKLKTSPRPPTLAIARTPMHRKGPVSRQQQQRVSARGGRLSRRPNGATVHAGVRRTAPRVTATIGNKPSPGKVSATPSSSKPPNSALKPSTLQQQAGKGQGVQKTTTATNDNSKPVTANLKPVASSTAKMTPNKTTASSTVKTTPKPASGQPNWSQPKSSTPLMTPKTTVGSAATNGTSVNNFSGSKPKQQQVFERASVQYVNHRKELKTVATGPNGRASAVPAQARKPGSKTVTASSSGSNITATGTNRREFNPKPTNGSTATSATTSAPIITASKFASSAGGAKQQPAGDQARGAGSGASGVNRSARALNGARKSIEKAAKRLSDKFKETVRAGNDNGPELSSANPLFGKQSSSKPTTNQGGGHSVQSLAHRFRGGETPASTLSPKPKVASNNKTGKDSDGNTDTLKSKYLANVKQPTNVPRNHQGLVSVSIPKGVTQKAQEKYLASTTSEPQTSASPSPAPHAGNVGAVIKALSKKPSSGVSKPGSNAAPVPRTPGTLRGLGSGAQQRGLRNYPSAGSMGVANLPKAPTKGEVTASSLEAMGIPRDRAQEGARKLIAESVDMMALSLVGDGDLRELGFTMGDRKKILQAFSNL